MSLSTFSSRLKRWAPIMVLGLIPFISGCNDGDDPSPSLDIVETALAADQFSVLAEAVVAADLTATLQSEGPFTVFAPTNDAFTQLLADLGLTKDQLFADTDLLTSVLTYHVLSGSVLAQQALSVAQSDMNMVDSVQGSPVSLSISNENGSDVLYANTSAVTATNIYTTNGIIHQIDKVLLPPSANALSDESKTIAGIVTDLAGAMTPEFTILLQALQAASLDTALDGEGPFTVFAPTDQAFSNLLAELGISASDLLASPDLPNILLQHVVGLEVPALAAYAANGSEVETLRAGTSVSIDIMGGVLMVEGSNVVEADVNASNGVIHVIDSVIFTVD